MPPPAGIKDPVAQLAVYDPKLKLPYTTQWNVSADQGLGEQQMLTVSYVGAIGRRLLRQDRYQNPNPHFAAVYITRNSSTSDYNALQMSFRRRLRNGFQVLSSYTWAHSLDDASSDTYRLTQDARTRRFELRYPPDLDRGADLRHSLAQLGRGAGDRVALVDRQHEHGAYRAAVRPGFCATSFINGAYVDTLPVIVAGVPFYLDDPNVGGGRRVNAAAFKAPPAGQSGTASRNILRGFSSWQSDLAVRRQFAFRDKYKLQVRAEAFNVFNHPNFSNPTNSLTSGLFGISTSMLGRSLGSGGGLGGFAPIYQIGGPRSLQLAMKLQF